jgi:hypothetical protein
MVTLIAEDAYVGVRPIVCGDDIVRGETWGPVVPRRAGASATAAFGFVRHTL